MKIDNLKLKKGQTMTLEEIQDFGNKIKMIDDLITQCYTFSCRKFGKSRGVSEELRKELSRIGEMRSKLDDYVHQIEIQGATEDFDLRDIFYGERNYEKICKNN